VAWYERSLGLIPQARHGTEAVLGDGSEPLVALHEDAAARPAGRHAGLYHYALLLPSRRALAHAAIRLGATRTPVQGASDHGTHEAIYLPDADGNGIELAADRPPEQWPGGLGYQAGPRPLDLEALLATADGDEPADGVGEGLRVGHVHLHVGDIEQGLSFYRDILGFEEQANLGSAAFVSAGGYHHHLAFNVWRGVGVGPPPDHAVGVRRWTVLLPTRDDVDAVRARLADAGVSTESVDGGFLARDPWQIAVAFLAGDSRS
jgi:catechol 2,3-dioxygenase